MMNNVKRRNVSSSLTSGKDLKAMFGEEEEILEEDELEEAELDLDDNDADDYDDDNDSEMEDADTDEDELDLDDSDDDVDSNAGSDDEIDSNDDAEVEQSGDDEWDAEEDDLLVLKFSKRKARLSKDWHTARVGKPSAERQKGKDGETWVRVTIPFEVKKGDDKVTVPFRASRNLSPKGRLYPIVEGILGREPWEGLDLRKLEGKRVKIEIDHSVDERGNVWEEVIAIEKAS